jgi:hypothetical protein
MKGNKLPVILAFLVLLLASLACEASASTANIADVWMSADEAGDQRVTSYAQDANFYAQVDLQNAPDDTVLKAVWTAVEAQDTEANLVITETEFTTGSGVINFNLTNDNLWPIGTYKVEIYMNDILSTTLEFEVQ